MNSTLLTIVIPAGAGLLGGVVGSLVAPWVHWGIEKRRSRLESRRNLVQEWKRALDIAPFDWDAFRESAAYASLRLHLSPKAMALVESGSMLLGSGGRGQGINNFRPFLLDEVARIEREWLLV